jgi:hypothetical protein
MIILKLSILFNFSAFIVGCIQYKYFSKEFKTIFYFVALGVITEIYSNFHLYFWMKNTMPIGHFYFPLAFLILCLFYIQILRNFIKPIYILSILVIFEVYSIINSVFIQSLYEYASLVASIGALIIFLFSVAFFIKIMMEATITKLSAEPIIWVNSAILIYFAGNFFYYTLYNLRLIASMEVALLAGNFFGILNLLFYLVIAISFLMVKNNSAGQKQI